MIYNVINKIFDKKVLYSIVLLALFGGSCFGGKITDAIYNDNIRLVYKPIRKTKIDDIFEDKDIHGKTPFYLAAEMGLTYLVVGMTTRLFTR